MAEIPSQFHDLFNVKTFAHFSTVMPDGTPHVTPVWVDYDSTENYVLVNTARGRQKEQNVRRDPAVGLSMTAPDDSYRFLSIRGEVTEVTENGAAEHIDELANRYMGVDEYPNKDDEDGSRVVMKIQPEYISHS